MTRACSRPRWRCAWIAGRDSPLPRPRSRHGVWPIENWRPRHSAIPYSRSRVRPDCGSTIALRQPRTRLKSVDLPTLGRPTMATIGLDMDSIRPALAGWRRRRLWSTVDPVVLNRLWRRLIDPVIGPRPCAICGYGHAQTGWAVDPMRGAHARF